MAALVLLLVALEVLLFRSYSISERTTREFSDTTNVTLYLSNVQRETILLSSSVLRLERGSDFRRVELRLMLLERQLSIVGAAGESEPLIKTALPRMNRSLSAFSKLLQAARRQPSASARTRLAVPAADLGRQVKSLFDEQEHAQVGALADTLRGGEHSQRLIAGLATFALLLSVVLAVFLRRSIRRSFQRAYAALATEVQERTALQERLIQQALHDPLTVLGTGAASSRAWRRGSLPRPESGR